MNILKTTVVAIGLSLLSTSAFADTAANCKKDVAEFDAAVKTTKASKANVDKAMKLRNEAAKDCTEKGGSVNGGKDMDAAMKLIGIKK